MVASIVGASSSAAKRELSSDLVDDEGRSQKKKAKLSDEDQDEAEEGKVPDEAEEASEDDKLAIRQVAVTEYVGISLSDQKRPHSDSAKMTLTQRPLTR